MTESEQFHLRMWRLAEGVGLPLLAYVIGEDETPQPVLDLITEGGTDATDPRLEVWETLAVWWDETEAQSDDVRQRRYTMQSRLIEWDDATAATAVNVLRVQAGGTLADLPVECDGDPMAAALAGYARDVGPSLLIPPAPVDGPDWLVHRHAGGIALPNCVAFAELLATDTSFADRIEAGSISLTFSSPLMQNKQYSAPLAVFAEHLVLDAAAAVVIAGYQVTGANIMGEAVDRLNRLRNAVPTGGWEEILMVGVVGVIGSWETDIAVAGGHLRAITPHVQERLPRVLGQTPLARVVYEHPVRIELSPRDPTPEPPDQSVLTAFEMTQLAVLLTLVEHSRIGSFRQSWSLHLPFNIGAAGSVRWTPDPSPQPMEPISGHEDQIAEWCALIEANHHRNLTLAARRLLRAVNERSAIDDALVDAIIALESMLGSRAGELTFRVSAGVAGLLGDDADTREDLFNRTAKLYDLRSQVVHSGNVSLKETDRYPTLNHAAGDAIVVAATVLARLYEGPAELRECKNTDRTKRIVLGAAEAAGTAE